MQRGQWRGLMAFVDHAAPLIAAAARVTGEPGDAELLTAAPTLLTGMAARMRLAPPAHPRGATSVAMHVDASDALRALGAMGRVTEAKGVCPPRCTVAAVPAFVAAGAVMELAVEMRCGAPHALLQSDPLRICKWSRILGVVPRQPMFHKPHVGG